MFSGGQGVLIRRFRRESQILDWPVAVIGHVGIGRKFDESDEVRGRQDAGGTLSAGKHFLLWRRDEVRIIGV